MPKAEEACQGIVRLYEVHTEGVAGGSRDRGRAGLSCQGRAKTPWFDELGGLTELIWVILDPIERRKGLPEANQPLFLAQAKGSMPAGLRTTYSV